MSRATERALNAVIGARLRDFRLEQGYSLEAVARKLGHRWTVLQKIERGEVRLTVPKLLLVCEAMGVNPMDYFHSWGERPGAADRQMEAQLLAIARGARALSPPQRRLVVEFVELLGRTGEKA